MKIVVINGQNHKGSTWSIGNMLVQKIQGEKEVKEYFLPRDLNHFCMGCFACLEARERCPYWPEKAPILQDMQAADLLIFTSPNYCMMPSAPMKAFLDLFFTNWMNHKPLREMFSKRAVVISTAAGAGAKNTVKLIGNNLENWGVPEIHSYAAVVNAIADVEHTLLIARSLSDVSAVPAPAGYADGGIPLPSSDTPLAPGDNSEGFGF